jgi:hypothetical protein
MHPIIGGMIVMYIILVIIVLTSSGAKNVRMTSPGPLLIYLAYRSTKKDGESVTVFVDKVEADEICLGYKIKEKEKEYFIEEYSYWYYPCKKKRGKTKEYELVLKIKSVRQEIIYVTEETDAIPNDSWQFQDEEPGSDNTILKVEDLPTMTVAIDLHSS